MAHPWDPPRRADILVSGLAGAGGPCRGDRKRGHSTHTLKPRHHAIFRGDDMARRAVASHTPCKAAPIAFGGPALEVLGQTSG